MALGPVADEPLRADAAQFDVQDEAVADLQVAVDEGRRRVQRSSSRSVKRTFEE